MLIRFPMSALLTLLAHVVHSQPLWAPPIPDTRCPALAEGAPIYVDGRPVRFEDHQIRFVAYGDCDDYRSMGLETDLPVGCF